MRILAVVSETEPSLRPIQLALALGGGSAADVIGLCIIDGTPVGYGIGASIGPGAEALLLPVPALPPSSPDGLAGEVRAAAIHQDRVITVLAVEGVPTRIVPGAVAELEPDLLILPGLPPRGRLAALLLGDDWGPLLARSEIPVLLARTGGALSGAVVVILEDVGPSADAVRAVARLPLPPDAEVVILGLLPAGAGAGRARHRRRMVRRLDAARSMLAGAGHRPSVQVQESTSVDELLRIIDRLGAGIVVTASGHLGGRHRLSGLAESLARRSDRSVLLVPTSLQRHRRVVRAAGTRDRGARPAGSTRTVT